MILNIILMLLLYIFTLYWIFSTNVVYSLWGEFPLAVLLVPYVLTTLLWWHLLYLFISWLYKKTLHKNYWYSYGIFFIIFFIFYFWYYTNFDKVANVSESEFETRLANIDVKDENNWLIQLWELLKYNEWAKSVLWDLNDKIWNHYYCLSWKYWKNCEKESLDKSLEIYRLEKNNIESWNKKISKIIEYKYFKIDSTNNKSLSTRWLSVLLKANLFNVIDELEKWNTDKAISNLLLYSKLWNKLMNSDNELIWSFTSMWVSNRSNFNIWYILKSWYKLGMI